jgi:hypothetical protein
LQYSKDPPSRSAVRRYYRGYRAENGIPERCDNTACQFHTGPLQWCGKPLPLILDHKDGCENNNSPDNLRLLCPNCDSQQRLTRGGANHGRVQDRGEHGYSIRERGSEDKQCKVFDGAAADDQGDSAVEPARGDEQNGG